MIFTIDCEHIFFDRYNLTSEQKYEEAAAIIEKVFGSSVLDKENGTVELYAGNAPEEIKRNERIRLLKREFFLLLKEEKVLEAPIEAPDEIDIAEKYVRSNYLYEEFCASRVCDYCNMSRRRLDKGFEERFSISVSEYIKALRVDKATELIVEGVKMEKAAYLSGFGSVKTMQRAFKSVCGKTPGEYRVARLDSNRTK